MAWDEQAFFNDYRDRTYGPAPVAVAMVIIGLCLGGLAYGMMESGVMDVEHTYAEHFDGPLEEVYSALLATRDGGSCEGSCGEVVASISTLGDEARAQASACLSETDSLYIRKKHGDFRSTILLTMRCGDGTLWRAELRNDVREDVLLSGGEIPSNWSLTSIAQEDG